MRITQIAENKKQYLDLLLLGDEQESMIDRYLDCGEMFALFDDDLRAVCVVTWEDKGTLELKNLAVQPKYQEMGYGKKMIAFLLEHYKGRGHVLLAGTGDSPLTVPFYQSCGFTESHRIPNFFTVNYDHPIYEGGTQLVDMLYFKKEF